MAQKENPHVAPNKVKSKRNHPKKKTTTGKTLKLVSFKKKNEPKHKWASTFY